MTIERLSPDLNSSPSFNLSIFSIFSFFFAADDVDRQLLFPLVGHARKNDLQHAVLQLRDGPVRVDRARQGHALDEGPEITLHAEEPDALAGPDPPPLASARRQNAPPNRQGHVLRLDPGQLDQDA